MGLRWDGEVVVRSGISLLVGFVSGFEGGEGNLHLLKLSEEHHQQFQSKSKALNSGRSGRFG